MRSSEIKRKTAETDISLKLDIDGSGKFDIDTGSGFFNHMLELFTRHGRFDMTVQNPELLDGMEVYNGHPGHNSNNDIAEIWASKYGLRKSSGSDFHGDKGDMPPGGIYFGKKITFARKTITFSLHNSSANHP